jgi:hypothetical protein
MSIQQPMDNSLRGVPPAPPVCPRGREKTCREVGDLLLWVAVASMGASTLQKAMEFPGDDERD